MAHNPAKNAWLEVGDELESIGLKLKLHLEQEGADEDDDGGGAFERLAQKIDVAVDAAENAVEDDAVREDLRETGRRLVDAISTTYREASRSVRRHVEP